MKPISEKVFTHTTKHVPKYAGMTPGGWYIADSSTPIPTMVPKISQQWTTLPSLRAADSFDVSDFRSLVRFIAELGYYNYSFNLLFRGQGNDYLDQKGRTKIYPSIFRPNAGKNLLPKPVRERRYEVLLQATDFLKAWFDDSDLVRHPAFAWALLQHYEICPTPLLDITQSLRVAASFALRGRSSGYLYVLAVPQLQGTITYSVNDSLQLVKLSNVCPPQALRPHFQEGYLIGRWPQDSEKTKGDNAAHRLIGKYRLDNTTGKFWQAGFQPIPCEALIPTKDTFRMKLENHYRKNFSKLTELNQIREDLGWSAL